AAGWIGAGRPHRAAAAAECRPIGLALSRPAARAGLLVERARRARARHNRRIRPVPPCEQCEQMATPAQDKQKEITFFDAHAAADDYDVFTPEASARLVDAFVRLTGLQPRARVADLGCGSGTFTALLARAGYDCVGLDISAKLIAVG